MCLAIPAQIIERMGDDRARVDMGGVRKEISLALLNDAQVGEWVIVHVGYALSRLDPAEAEKTLRLFNELSALNLTSGPGKDNLPL